MRLIKANLESLGLNVDLRRESQESMRKQQDAEDRSSNTPPRIELLDLDSLAFLCKLFTTNVTTKTE